MAVSTPCAIYAVQQKAEQPPSGVVVDAPTTSEVGVSPCPDGPSVALLGELGAAPPRPNRSSAAARARGDPWACNLCGVVPNADFCCPCVAVLVPAPAKEQPTAQTLHKRTLSSCCPVPFQFELAGIRLRAFATARGIWHTARGAASAMADDSASSSRGHGATSMTWWPAAPPPDPRAGPAVKAPSPSPPPAKPSAEHRDGHRAGLRSASGSRMCRSTRGRRSRCRRRRSRMCSRRRRCSRRKRLGRSSRLIRRRRHARRQRHLLSSRSMSQRVTAPQVWCMTTWPTSEELPTGSRSGRR